MKKCVYDLSKTPKSITSKFIEVAPIVNKSKDKHEVSAILCKIIDEAEGHGCSSEKAAEYRDIIVSAQDVLQLQKFFNYSILSGCGMPAELKD